MMQEREFVFNQWDSKSSKRSSGLFSVLKWFRNESSRPAPPPDLLYSNSSSCESINSVYSTDTVASFAFVSPHSYKPFGGALQPEKYILPGPETATYRARIAQREIRRENDRELTLRSKYNLYKAAEPDRGHSLPLMTKTEEIKGLHRRTASESSKYKTAGAHLHVKGKRRAPQPPGMKGEGGTARRKKRMAPQPPTNPEVLCNDSLKLDRGILKPAKQQNENKIITVQEVSQVTPRPWYKRTTSNKVGCEKKSESEKRKSCNLSYLTNISELDREAMEILERKTLKMKYLRSNSQAPAFMRPRAAENTPTSSDSWVSPKRRSARDLIAKFNAITGTSKKEVPTIQEHSVIEENNEKDISVSVKEGSPADKPITEPKRSLPNSPILRTNSNKITRTPWNCPRCTLENEYWRIICRACSAIKPYFDDFTSEKINEVKMRKDRREELSRENKRLNDLLEKKSFLFPKTTSIQERESNNESIFSQSSSKFSDMKVMFEPSYPKVKMNLDKYMSRNISNGEPSEKQGKMYEIQKSASQPRVSIFDYDKNIDKTKSRIPKENILEQILKEIKQKEEQNRETESKLQNFCKDYNNHDTKIMVNIETALEKNKQTVSNKVEVEKIILGDEIRVEKPQYMNILSNPTEEKSKNEEKKMKIVEKIILGDEIKSKKENPAQDVNAGVKVVGVKLKSELNKSEDISKKEEREKLKKMLIEMKNSLPKRIPNKVKEEQKRISMVTEEQGDADSLLYIDGEKAAELMVVTTETTYEKIKVKNTDQPKPIKVSSSAQTNAIVRRNPTPDEAEVIKSNYQLIGAKDFTGISNEKILDMAHTYANVAENKECRPVASKVYPGRSNTDTIEINRLLKRLESAIAGGELGQAAVLARDLAQLKIPCTVVRQTSIDKEEKKATTNSIT